MGKGGIHVNCGIFIVRGGSMFVDFVGNIYPRNYVPTHQQNFDNPQTLTPTNKNDFTVLYKIKYIHLYLNTMNFAIF